MCVCVRACVCACSWIQFSIGLKSSSVNRSIVLVEGLKLVFRFERFGLNDTNCPPKKWRLV